MSGTAINLNYRAESGVVPQFRKKVFFTGSTALDAGQGLCYDADTGTAANADYRRWIDVELPASGNNLNFAGVTESAHAAVSGGQWVTIFEPGSVCPIAISDAVLTVASSRVTCLASGTAAVAGRFVGGDSAGILGRGTATVLQTAATYSTASATTVVSSSTDSSASATTTVITKTGIGTNARVGDKVYVTAGSVTASSATAVTAGLYTVTDGGIDGATPATGTITVSSSICAAASLVVVYVVRGNPTVLARLHDGEESGLVEHHSLITGARTLMVGGKSIIVSGTTMSTADATATLANGLYTGMRKHIYANSALATNQFLLTITKGVVVNTGGATASASYSVGASVEFDQAGDELTAWWTGTCWVCHPFNFTVANNPTIA